MGNIIGPLAGMSANGGAGTPAAWSYPQAQSLYGPGSNLTQQYLTGGFGGQPTMFDQLSGNAVGSAMNAGNLYGQLMPDIFNQIGALAQGAGGGMQYLPQLMSNAFNPMYGQQVGFTANNPNYAQAMTGAAQGAALGGAGANSLYGAGQGILQSGFDPQSALFNRTQQQVMDQAGATNAMMGLGASPYGAGATNKAMSDFDINWQNQQLGRQESAAGAASPLLQAAPGLAASSAAMPSNTYLSQIGAVLSALDQQNKAGALGASAFPSLLGGIGQGLGQANSLASGIGQNTANFGMAPYQAGATIAGNAQSGLGNLQNQLSGATNLGNNQFQLPQQVLGDLMQYMGLGQSASGLSGQLGQMGFNQTAQGLGGLLSGGNALFGSNGLLGGSGGLFGGGSGAIPASDFFAPLNALDAVGGAGAGGGLGSSMMSALPAMAMSA
jgi:hypothetical protein